MKKGMVGAIIFLLLAGTLAFGGDENGKIVMWHWDEQFATKIVPEFNKVYPNIKMDIVMVSAYDYLEKFQVSLASGYDLPDVVAQDRFQRGPMWEMDVWEDLESPPYNFKRSDIFDFAIPLMQDANGKIRGIVWDMALVGLAYKRNLAKQFLGTDDPRQLQKMMPDWDSFIAKGEQVQKQSGGNAYMFSGLNDAFVILGYQGSKKFADGNKILLSASWKRPFEILARMNAEGIVDKNEIMSPGWNASVGGNKHIFFAMPMWGPHFIIEGNDPNGKGNWGLMVPPEGGSEWGGTSLGILKKSENKLSAWKFIQWFTLSKEGAYANKRQFGYYTYYKKTYDDATFVKWDNVYFAPQNIGDIYFKGIAPKAKFRPITKYDHELYDLANLTMKSMVQDKSMSGDKALAFLKGELENKFPDAEVQ